MAEWLRFLTGELPLPFVPELPDRGAPAAMIGRTAALLVDLAVDLQPAGWRLAPSGLDHRRAQSLLAQDLDRVEELGGDHDGPFKQQVTGPWTLAATVERPRGDKVLADHGARRDLAESLAEGLRVHVADLRRRVPGADWIVQVDEPSLPAVLAARIPTASGFGRHRTIHPPEVDAHLRLVADAIRDAGATPVIHCCAPDVPVELLAGAGFAAVSFDASLNAPDDAWAEVFESGVDLWPGVTDLRRVEPWFGRLGFDEDTWGPRVTVTPPCGLASSSPAQARQALIALRS